MRPEVVQRAPAAISPPRPLTEHDDRTGFECGRESLNQWFRRHAWQNQQAHVSRTSVLCDQTPRVVGFVALSAAQIERGHLPKSALRNRPDPIPAILLGQLAVDLDHQHRGYARSLLLYALTTSLRLSRDIGCHGVLTHPVDDQVRAFYAQFGFEDLPFDPGRSMFVRMIDLERSGFG